MVVDGGGEGGWWCQSVLAPNASGRARAAAFERARGVCKRGGVAMHAAWCECMQVAIG